MWKAVVAIALIFIVVVSVSVAFSQDTLRYAVDEASSYAQRPDSAVDIALRGSELYADTQDGDGSTGQGVLMGIVVVFFVIVVFVGVGGFLHLRTGYLKQARLNSKASKRRTPAPPSVRIMPPDEAPVIGTGRSVPQLEDRRESYQDYGY